MRMVSMSTLIVLTTIMTSPATAESEVQVAGAAHEAASDDKRSEMVCRREPVMGTHMQRKVCRTRAEIEAQRAAAESSMRELRNRSANRTNPQ